VDFKSQRLVYLHMGARRTGGYRLDLAGETADLVGKTLVIPVSWQEPGEDALVTQMLTHPCLLLVLPRGAYNRIEVVDQSGQTRLSTTIQSSTP
jgi:hypothetical protein